MTADRFESRVAEWLEDGPEAASSAVVAAVLDHARTHPRSRVRTFGLRARRLAPALAAAAALVVLACGSLGALSFFRGPATPIAPVQVTGTQTCTTRVAGAVLSPQAGTQGSDEVRGRIDGCVLVGSDPRVTGQLTRKLDAWRFDPDSTWFGTMEIRNDRGTWAGSVVGTSKVTDATGEGRMTWYAVGSGVYRGLAYRATATTDALGHTTVSGTIEGIEEDAFVANTWCWVDSADPDISVTDAVHRVATRDCVVTSTDDRIAGTVTETRSIDVAPDGSTHDKGDVTLATANGGTWRGTFAGTGNWYVPGEISGIAEGSGSLAGQRLTFRVASEDGMHGVLLGSIEPSR